MTTRQEVCDEARSWLRTPYHHGAGLRGIGADCARYPLAVYTAVGAIPETDVGQYPHDWHLHRSEELYLAWVRRFGDQIGEKPRDTQEVIGAMPSPGDFIIWKWGRTYSHGAIYLGEGVVIHSAIDVGVSTDDMWQHEELRTRAALYFSIRGL